MQREFQDPPREFRMLQIIHGFPPGESLEATLDLLVERGYGGVVCNVGFDQYLESEEQWEHFLRGFDACRARGLRVWIYDERGYPSGKAGTLVLREHPELETRGLVMAKTVGEGSVVHHLPVDERIEGAPVAAVAVPYRNGTLDLRASVDLAERVAEGEGSVSFEGEGPLAVLSFHVKRMREGTHIVCNYSDDYPYINILDPRATQRFIEVTHEQYAERLGQKLAQVEAMFTDEPSLMTMYLKAEEGLLPAVPYSDELLEVFTKQKGYDLRSSLPALFEDCGPRTARFRLDYWHVVSGLVEESFYGQLQTWCRGHGLNSSGHALTEEQLFWHVGFEGDLYRDLRRMHEPGIDMLSSNPTALVRSGEIPIPKFVSSVAHMSGAPRCMSETSSHSQRMSGQECTPDQRFGTINFQYVLGVNEITSYYGMDEMDPETMAQFNAHIGRLGYMLTGGTHVSHVGVYYPIHTAWAGFVGSSATAYEPCPASLAAVNESFAAVSRQLLWNQIDFDYLDDAAIQGARIQGGGLKLRGEVFYAIVLPHAEVIPYATYRKLADFLRAGGCLVFCDVLPSMALESRDDGRVRSLSGELRNHVRVEIVQEPRVTADVLTYFVPHDVTVCGECPDLLYVHRIKNGRHVYFFTNCGDGAIAPRVTMAVRGQPELWHPRTGLIEPATIEDGPAGTTMDLPLAPYEGVLVVFHEGAKSLVGPEGEAESPGFERETEGGRGAREPRGGKPRGPKDAKGGKEPRDGKEAKAAKDTRGARDSKDGREPGDGKEARASRGSKARGEGRGKTENKARGEGSPRQETASLDDGTPPGDSGPRGEGALPEQDVPGGGADGREAPNPGGRDTTSDAADRGEQQE